MKYIKNVMIISGQDESNKFFCSFLYNQVSGQADSLCYKIKVSKKVLHTHIYTYLEYDEEKKLIIL
jgi:hypothetical protein